MADAEITFDPIKKAYDEGYAAGWAAYGDLMIEQLGPDGMVWRPIETAPKDGRYFIAWSSRDGVILMQSHNRTSSETWSLEGSFKSPEPTHWMPLPKPPAARKEAACSRGLNYSR